MEPVLLALIVVIVLFSVIIHEVMHGVMALRFGDRTALHAGRLTLNPLPHIDPIGTVLIPFLLILTGSPILFGWAKPVPVNPFNFRDIRKGEFFVSIAGILANLTLAIIAGLIVGFASNSLSPVVGSALLFTIDINLILAVFNLLPVPPLDGSKILMSFLPPHLAAEYQKLERYGLFILLFLLLIPLGRTTIIGLILGTVLRFAHSILGL